MGSSTMITLFAEPPQSRSFPASYVVSILLHSSLLSLLTIKILTTPRIIERFSIDRYALQVLDFHSTPPQTRQAAGGGIVYHSPQQGMPSAAAHKLGGASSGSPQVTRQTAQLMPAPQTLIQPDVP